MRQGGPIPKTLEWDLSSNSDSDDEALVMPKWTGGLSDKRQHSVTPEQSNKATRTDDDCDVSANEVALLASLLNKAKKEVITLQRDNRKLKEENMQLRSNLTTADTNMAIDTIMAQNAILRERIEVLTGKSRRIPSLLKHNKELLEENAIAVNEVAHLRVHILDLKTLAYSSKSSPRGRKPKKKEPKLSDLIDTPDAGLATRTKRTFAPPPSASQQQALIDASLKEFNLLQHLKKVDYCTYTLTPHDGKRLILRANSAGEVFVRTGGGVEPIKDYINRQLKSRSNSLARARARSRSRSVPQRRSTSEDRTKDLND